MDKYDPDTFLHILNSERRCHEEWDGEELLFSIDVNEVKLHEILDDVLLQDAEKKKCGWMSDFYYGKEHICSAKMLPLKLLQCDSIVFRYPQKAKKRRQNKGHCVSLLNHQLIPIYRTCWSCPKISAKTRFSYILCSRCDLSEWSNWIRFCADQ